MDMEIMFNSQRVCPLMRIKFSTGDGTTCGIQYQQALETFASWQRLVALPDSVCVGAYIYAPRACMYMGMGIHACCMWSYIKQCSCSNMFNTMNMLYGASKYATAKCGDNPY